MVFPSMKSLLHAAAILLPYCCHTAAILLPYCCHTAAILLPYCCTPTLLGTRLTMHSQVVRQIIYSHYSSTVHDRDLPGREDTIPDLFYLYDLYDLYDLYHLYDLAHVTGWDPCNLHDIQQW